MPADISLGNNYQIDENSNGNLVIKDSTDTVVLKHTDGGNLSLGAALELGDLVDGASGDSVYDGSTDTVGASSINGEFGSLSTDDATIANTLGVADASIEGSSPSTSIRPYRDDVSDGSTVNIVDGPNPIGTVIIDNKSGGGVALVALQGALNNTAILADASGDFSTTQGNSGTINIYYDGSAYVAENQTGGGATLSRWLIA